MAHDWKAELLTLGFELAETHISHVFLRGDEVYKLKRPVALGFLDFSSLELRERACLAEVELNRRLAPDVYLGVVALVRDEPGQLTFVPRPAVERPRVLEWAVHMRRLRDSDRADSMLAAGELGVADVERLATAIARFHQRAPCNEATTQYGMPARILQNVQENFGQVEHSVLSFLRPDEREHLFAYQTWFLERHAPLFIERARAGRVRDGHGDLRLEHCYRDPSGGFLIIDCIEFNERFRFGDVCADLAFLAMDLCHHDRVDLAELLVAAYARESGDYGIYDVLDFYQSYRAVVRAKVSSLLASDEEVRASTRERACSEARRYYLLGLAAAGRALAPTRLIVSFGLIASGKSALACALAAELALPVVSADLTRKQLLNSDPTDPHREAAFQGAYGERMTERVYEELLARAAHVLASGRSVVLDASFRSRAQRERARALALRTGAVPIFFECRCARNAAMERLARRAREPSVSDGRAEIYDEFAACFEPADELSDREHLVLDTEQPLERTVEAARARL